MLFAAKVAEIGKRIAGVREVCVFAEPQFDPRIVAVVTENALAMTTASDPTRALLEPRSDLYPALRCCCGKLCDLP